MDNRIKIRKVTGGFSEIQAKIIMIRGFSSEEVILNQKDFAEQLKKPLTTINYNILRLRKRGIITTLNFLTPDGKVVFQKLKRYLNNTKKLRGHKIFGKIILNEGYREFDKVREKYLKISNSPKHKGFRIEFKDCVVLFYSPKKIIFYLPDIYADSIDDIYFEAYVQYIEPLIKYLKQNFRGLKVDKYENASMQINHLAYLHHPLAEIFKEFNAQYSSDRLEVDHSHGVPELETVHKKHSVEDMDEILDYERWIRRENNDQ